MKILIANYEFPPVGGGASKVSYKLARTLVGLGHDVLVLTSRTRGQPDVEDVDGITVHRTWSWRKGVHDCGLRGAFTYLLSALPRLRKMLNNEDVEVVHYFFGLPTGILSLYSYSLRNLPYIISLRGSDVPLYDRDSRKLRILHALTRPLSHKIWRDASRVFAVSKGLGDLARASFPDIQVGVIHNGIDVRDQEVPRCAGPGEKKIRLICVSRLIPRKGIHNLLDTLAGLSDLDVHLTLIGAGPSEPALKALAESLGISHLVSFAGYCTPEEIDAHYSQSDIFVLPTHSDAFANVILEAMSAGLPVVASDVGGVAEAVVDGETGILVRPRRTDDLAQAIRELAEDAELRMRLGAAGTKRAREVFAWEDIATLHIEAYTNAIEGT